MYVHYVYIVDHNVLNMEQTDSME